MQVNPQMVQMLKTFLKGFGVGPQINALIDGITQVNWAKPRKTTMQDVRALADGLAAGTTGNLLLVGSLEGRSVVVLVQTELEGMIPEEVRKFVDL